MNTEELNDSPKFENVPIASANQIQDNINTMSMKDSCFTLFGFLILFLAAFLSGLMKSPKNNENTATYIIAKNKPIKISFYSLSSLNKFISTKFCLNGNFEKVQRKTDEITFEYNITGKKKGVDYLLTKSKKTVMVELKDKKQTTDIPFFNKNRIQHDSYHISILFQNDMSADKINYNEIKVKSVIGNFQFNLYQSYFRAMFSILNAIFLFKGLKSLKELTIFQKIIFIVFPSLCILANNPFYYFDLENEFLFIEFLSNVFFIILKAFSLYLIYIVYTGNIYSPSSIVLLTVSIFLSIMSLFGNETELFKEGGEPFSGAALVKRLDIIGFLILLSFSVYTTVLMLIKFIREKLTEDLVFMFLSLFITIVIISTEILHIVYVNVGEIISISGFNILSLAINFYFTPNEINQYQEADEQNDNFEFEIIDEEDK